MRTALSAADDDDAAASPHYVTLIR
jgi:hypothetical protein